MSMTLTAARAMVREYARNAGDSTMYSDTKIDHAIQAAGSEFCRETGFLRTMTTLALTAASNVLPTLPTDFRPENIREAFTTADDVDVVNYSEIAEADADSGPPTQVAFSSDSAGIVYPTPTVDTSLYIWYYQPFTPFTAGTASPGSVTITLPDDALIPCLIYGATSKLQFNEPEHGYAVAAATQFQQHIARYRGRGGLGVRSEQLKSSAYVAQSDGEEDDDK